MVLTGTNAPGAKTSGARTGNEAAWAGSGSPTASPTAANVRDIAFPDSSTSSPLARDAGAGPPSGGEPDGHHDDGDEHVLRQIRERPAASTAGRDIGSARKRAVSPLRASVAMPVAVAMEPDTTVCPKMPGHQVDRVGIPEAGQAGGAAEGVAGQ